VVLCCIAYIYLYVHVYRIRGRLEKRVIWSSKGKKSSSARARISTFEMVKYIVRPNLSLSEREREREKKKEKKEAAAYS